MFKRGLNLVLFLVLVLGVGLLQPLPIRAAGGARAVRTKVQPVYPDMARRSHIEGTVRIQVLVAPNGTVRKATVLGGNPLLAEAAVEAIQQWRYEPAPSETTEVVQMQFTY